jgi:hypothetical protein
MNFLGNSLTSSANNFLRGVFSVLVTVVIRLLVGRPENRGYIFAWAEIFLITAPRPDLPPPPPPQHSPAIAPMSARNQIPRAQKLTTRLHLVPNLKMLGTIPPLLHTSLWCYS